MADTENLTPAPDERLRAAPAVEEAAAAPVDALLPPGTSVGRYTIRELIGQGGMGQVYAASDPELERPVAVKLLRTPAGTVTLARRMRFLREAQAMARLVHPNVVSVFDVGAHGERVFVAMEFVEGETLAAWLARAPRDWRELRATFLAAGRGLLAAHDADIVHRDFKPENVLVGGGRVVVADFGLARGAYDEGDAPAPAESPAMSMLELGVTVTGGVVGTPGYVAPEVLAGGAATARSDQYSFCVALRAALGGRGPRFLGAVVERGLRVDPARRYPSMRELLRDLARDPGRTARRAALALAAAAAIGAGGYAAALSRAAPAADCASAGVGAAWDEGRRAAVARAFAATGLPFAAASAARVDELLSRYAAEWKAARTEACLATHARHAQSEALLDLRVQCLDRRRAALDALATALSGRLETGAVEQAVAAAARLPLVADCADTARLRTVAPLPAGAHERERVERALAAVEGIDALNKLGRFAEARAEVGRLEAEYGDLDYAPLASDLRFWRGWLLYRLARADPVRADEWALHASVRLAVAAGDPAREERGWRALFTLLTALPARFGECEQVQRAAEMALARAGRPAQAAFLYRMNVIRMYANRGQLVEAAEQVRVLAAEVPAADLWNRGSALELHAKVLSMLHRDEEAVAVGRAALALWERELGPDHPKVVLSLVALGAAYGHLQRYAESEEALQRALRIQQAVFGPDSEDLGDTYQRLAWLAAQRKDAAAARAYASRSVEVMRSVEKGDPSAWMNAVTQQGGILLEAGLSVEAEPILRAALALARGHSLARDTAIASYYLGMALQAQGKQREALELCTASEAMLAAAIGSSIAECRGEALLALGRAAEALPVLERALAQIEKETSTAAERVGARFALARALWATSRDRERSLALAAQAAAEARAAPLAAKLAEVEAWQRGRSSAR